MGRPANPPIVMTARHAEIRPPRTPLDDLPRLGAIYLGAA
jgi:hypothetical protein